MGANLKFGNPRNIRVAEAFEFETQTEARSMERQAHLHFNYKCHQKEWFNLSAKEISVWFKSNGAKMRGENSK